MADARDELEQIMVRGENSPELWAQVPEHMTLTRRQWAKEAADALSTAGYAVVPLEATWRMAEVALRELYKDDPITLDEIGQGHPPSHRLKECHVAINDAIAKGNILKGDG